MQSQPMHSQTMLNRPIFVVGSVHTGTTLISKVLNRHPDVFGGMGETCFFHHYPIITNRFPTLGDDGQRVRFVFYLINLTLFGYNQVSFDTAAIDFSKLADQGIGEVEIERVQAAVRAARATQYSDVFRLVNEELATIFGKTRWREKTPGHLHHIDRIMQHFPNAYVIELVRDPRDILASKQKRRAKDGSADSLGVAHRANAFESNFDPLLDTMAWKAAIGAGNRAQVRYPKQVLRVRYEDFVQNPAEQTKAICQFIDLPLSPAVLDDMLEVGWVNTTVAGQHGSKGIGTASIAKWKGQLSSNEIALCQQIVKREMTALGYEREPVSTLSLMLLPVQVVKSGWEVGRQLLLHQRMGNWSYTKSKLQNMWKRLAISATTNR